MASNKNQHFVPRCYLRAFASDGGGAMTNVFNLTRRRLIPNAPLKSQCSRSYFYGEDLFLEKALQKFEGPYAEMLREIRNPAYSLIERHAQQLRAFWSLQHLRTEATSRRLVEASEEMNSDIGLEDDRYRVTQKEAIESSIKLVPEIFGHIEDLRLCLVRNATDLPFVTSDHPAVSANRWHTQDVRARHTAPGLDSAGTLLLLPLTPRMLCLLYDGAVYSVTQSGGWVDVSSQEDVAAFNEHQYLNAQANVYFGDWRMAYEVERAFGHIARRRPPSRHRFHYLVFDRRDGNGEVFREVDAEEARRHERSIVHQEAVYPEPSQWPRLLRYRPDGRYWSNGSGAGYSRRARIPAGSHGYRSFPTRRSTR